MLKNCDKDSNEWQNVLMGFRIDSGLKKLIEKSFDQKELMNISHLKIQNQASLIASCINQRDEVRVEDKVKA